VTEHHEHADRLPWQRLTLLWLAGMDLRITLLAVAPLLPIIHAELGLNEKGVAALSNLPVLVLGLAAIPGSMLVARIGARRALLVGLVTIAVGATFRGVGPSIPMLYGMTLLMGVGIAISQPTMSSLVREWFPHAVARATGVWSNGLLMGELMGASLTLPFLLPLVGGSWELVLGLWAIPVILTALLLAPSALQPAPPRPATASSGFPDFRNPLVWQLGLLQSSAGLIYFGANTFFPDYLYTHGQPELVAPTLISINLVQVPASFLVGVVPWRILASRFTWLLIGALTLASLPALVSGSAALLVGAAGFTSFLGAVVLVVCFALPALLVPPEDVARLSAGTFVLAYTMTFTSNLAAGALWDATHQPAWAFLPILFGGAIALLLGPRLVTASAAGMPGRAAARS
jgi:MFS transporter, CP family, cyanate transporter